jgi:hypothetical protein
MSPSFYGILLFLTLFVHVGCKPNTHTSQKEKWEIRQERQTNIDSLNQQESEKLSQTFDAVSGSDTTIKFTSQIQEAVSRHRMISIIGRVNDITKTDTGYILKVQGTFGDHDFFADLVVAAKQYGNLVSKPNFKAYTSKACFIVAPRSISSSSMLTIGSEVTNGSTEDASSQLTYDYNDVLIFIKGTTVNYYLYKELEDDAD